MFTATSISRVRSLYPLLDLCGSKALPQKFWKVVEKTIRTFHLEGDKAEDIV